MNITTVVSLLLSGIKLINAIIDWYGSRQLIESGKGLAVAEALAATMKKVAHAKEIEAAVAKLSDADVANELSKFGTD